MEIQETGTVRPEEFENKADIARFRADVERIAESKPNPIRPLSEFHEDGPEPNNELDIYTSEVENRGFNPEEVDYGNRTTLYEQRIDYLNLLDQWPV